MLKNAKICPAILGTEELVAYLHTLLQENSHNMRSLWVNDANEATLPVRFQQETKRWKIAKAAQTAGQQILKEYNAMSKVQQQAPQKDVLEKAMKIKLNKIKILKRKTGGYNLEIPTREREDGVRVPDITPMKTRRTLNYDDAYVATSLKSKARLGIAFQLQREYDEGVSSLTEDEIKEAKVTLAYEDELRAAVGQGTTEEDLNNALLRVYNFMARQMFLTHMTGLLQPRYEDYTSARTASAWGDHEGHLESTKTRLLQAMHRMIGLNPVLSNLHVYVLKTTRALEVLRWFCSIYKKEKKVARTIKDAQEQIALQLEQVFLAGDNVTPMLANANEDVKRGVLTKYEFYVNALDSMERSRSELASQGKQKDKAVRFMKKRRRDDDSGEETGGGAQEDPSEGEEEEQPVRKLSLKNKQGSKLAAELQTTRKSTETKQVYIPGKTEDDDSSLSSDEESLTKPRYSAKKPKKGASKKSSKAPKNDSLENEDGLVEPSSPKQGTPRKKSKVNKIKKKKESDEEEEEDEATVLHEAIRKVMAEQKSNVPKSPIPCRLFQRGACNYGASCRFTHAQDAAGAQNPPAGADAQRDPRPRRKAQGQQHPQQRNSQQGYQPGALPPPGFIPPPFFPPGAAPPAGLPPAMLQLPAGQQPLMLPYYPPAGVPPNARPQGQVNLLNQNGPSVRPGSLCDNLMRIGKCNYRICKGPHGAWTQGAPICRFETERKPCPHQANGSCNFMHNVARGN